MDRVTNQRAHWDILAWQYEKHYGLDKAQAKLKRKAQLLIDGTGMVEKDDVLEIGCGTGIFTELLAGTGAFINGIDVSPEMVRIADAKFHENHLAWIECMDAHEIDYPDRSFDIIVGAYILQYLDLPRALPEIRRLLKPGGRVAFIDINTLNPLACLKTKFPFTKKLLNISREAVSFTPWEIMRWFEYYFRGVEVLPFEFGSPLLNRIEAIPILKLFAGSLLITAYK